MQLCKITFIHAACLRIEPAELLHSQEIAAAFRFRPDVDRSRFRDTIVQLKALLLLRLTEYRE